MNRNRQIAWLVASVSPAVVGPAWIWLWSLRWPDDRPLWASLSGIVLIALVSTAAITDLAWRRIPNWLTYTSAVWGLLINSCATLSGNARLDAACGAVGLDKSLAGGCVLFVVVLLVSAVTGGGAGDVKFAGGLGTLLGIDKGTDALAYSFVVAGFAVLTWAILRHGPLMIVTAFARLVGGFFLPRWISGPTAAQRALLVSPVPLGPFFACGTLLCLFLESF